MNKFKLSKDQIQKIGLSLTGLVFLLYIYFNFFLGPLNRSRNALAARRASERMDRALLERFAAATRGLDHRRQRLVALSPEGVLSRGYSITQDADSGTVLRTSDGTAVDRRVRIMLGAGRLGARVDEVDS